MAQKKKTYKATPGSTAKKPSNNGRKNGTAGRKKGNGAASREKSDLSRFYPFILFAAAVFLIIAFLIPDFGVVGNFIRDKAVFGLFSNAAYLLPAALIASGTMALLGAKIRHGVARRVTVWVSFLLSNSLFHLFGASEEVLKEFSLVSHFTRGTVRTDGGAVGGVLGAVFAVCFSRVGAIIIVILVLLALCFVLAGKTPMDLFAFIRDLSAEARERRLEREFEEEREAALREEAREYSKFGGRSEEPRERENAPRRYRAEWKIKDRRKAVSDEYLGIEDESEEEADGLDKRFDPSLTEDAPEKEVQLEIPPADSIPEFPDGKEEILEPVAERADGDGTDAEEDELLFDDPADEEVLRRLSETYLGTSEGFSVKSRDLSPTLDRGNVVDIPEGESTGVKKTEEAVPKPEPPVYVFPKIDLLTKDKKTKTVDSTKELSRKESTLIQTLERFNVHTESAGLPAKGPTITRYELRPMPGTRVRSIVNLVDDISLSLATQGIRIEAPIPGKSAVGIEVPNDEREIVRLRTLIDTPAFRDAKSRTNVVLGKDVAGSDVFFDIAKMPHLLIAGATGMGKSVCINSIIVSLLYKASPDEVKLILIDPKKVEFSMYGSLPHLLVPVVSDPKKAAGALSWAVNEMERRFSLIDGEGVRNNFGYNEAVKDDPTKEKLPQIVIIIDELADLMMTAPDNVEDSICRLAQKARAAGMHLIIGTQRPSVDVITGTIKGNIPSRIAFTVASQVDSKIILDTSGAEKLIGQGDMLFSPVGQTKPMRVQGAFISDGEVESVVEFIKEKNSGEIGYSDDVMAQIESEAAKCLSKKSSAMEEAAELASDEDPKFWEAVELAVESGKISTSLIQRKCSLGFGRAAKLIDRMEELGFVSAPDGQKPRQVKLTKDQLMEIKAGGVPSEDAE